MRTHESGEDYLETILRLYRKQGYVRSTDIANAMNYTKASISRAVKILKEDGYIYFNEEGLYCLVDGTVTVEKVDGKLKVEVDAVNSYDLSVKLHYNEAGTPVENITTEKTNVSKRLVNGQLLIIRNGATYNATGALVK